MGILRDFVDIDWGLPKTLGTKWVDNHNLFIVMKGTLF